MQESRKNFIFFKKNGASSWWLQEQRSPAGTKSSTGGRSSFHPLAANQARLLVGVLTYKLLHMLRQLYLGGAEVKRSREWLIKRLIKVGKRSLWPSPVPKW